jgi:hypothetical protein
MTHKVNGLTPVSPKRCPIQARVAMPPGRTNGHTYLPEQA